MICTKKILLGSFFTFLVAIGLGLFFSPLAFADEVAPEVLEEEPVEGDIADPYDLFDPVPASLMRPMVTDRPTFADSPRTVDAGHFQLETTLFEYEKNQTATGFSQTYLVNQMNLKLGLNLDADFQANIQTYKIVSTGSVKKEGFGDITLRLKFNLFGNDRGLFAGALIPFLKLPTNPRVGNPMFEGGLYFPVEWIPSEDWSVVLMVGPEFMKNATDNNFHFEVVGAAAVSTVIAKKYVPFVEFKGKYNAESKISTVSVGGGMAYQLGQNWQIDAGTRFGLNVESADFAIYTGTSFRI